MKPKIIPQWTGVRDPAVPEEVLASANQRHDLHSLKLAWMIRVSAIDRNQPPAQRDLAVWDQITRQHER